MAHAIPRVHASGVANDGRPTLTHPLLPAPPRPARHSAKDMIVPAQGRAVIPTDLSIALPAGTYGRVAPRSGLAVKHFIDVGGRGASTCCPLVGRGSGGAMDGRGMLTPFHHHVHPP
jgi:hypothetical protein